MASGARLFANTIDKSEAETWQDNESIGIFWKVYNRMKNFSPDKPWDEVLIALNEEVETIKETVS